MADNSTAPSTGGLPIASDDIGGVQFQRVKLVHGADGVNAGDVAVGNGLPVKQDGAFTVGLPSGASTSAKQDSILAKLAQFYAEDAAHVSGDAGYMLLVVRKDSAGTLAGSDGDYSPLQVDSNGNLRVTQVSEALPAGTDRSGTIAIGGTGQTLAAANASRKGLTIQNTSNEDLRVREDGSTASSTTGYLLPAGASASINTNKLISIWGATTSQSFAATEW